MNSFIDGTTRSICLLGYPVEHSISPLFQNYALRSLKLPFVYIPLSVSPQSLHNAVYMLRSNSFAGANVTIPHKESVLKYCDKISQLSARTKTVNTLYFNDGRLLGTTTDSEGFFRSLQYAGHKSNDDTIVILGNGGTARTLACAIALEKCCKRLSLAGRSFEKVSRLANSVSDETGFSIDAYSLSDPAFKNVLSECTLLVNCTSVGMYPNVDNSPLDKSCFHSGMTVFDCIYNPRKTLFLSDAESAGCRIINGLGMLLFQGLASFKLWTGKEVPEHLFDLDELQELVSNS
ncbi:shikimate dehydrogenase [Chitinispirillales bacterium ANBcel5]|uniref:shikimate dehydrogenase n=1 Tax=Cellulosispirillum alkaliphilum TaxID=3039283 RepID=UPI002A55D971|nr:shikimate dehydrogenase [Chitinispirillales bacterium ANBcel5]